MFQSGLKIAALISLCFVQVSAFATQVNGVRLWRAPEYTRIVFDLGAPAEHNLFTLENPNRIVIDISDSTLAKKIADLPLENTPINQVRYGLHNKKDLRVVFDLRQAVIARSFLLAKHGDKADRLVIDLNDINIQPTKTAPDIKEFIDGKRDIIIAVDAGHGGEDPGAIGPYKIQEKKIVLAISQQLVGMINKKKGYKAVLVRDGDYYIPLKSRRDKARALRADLFVSIHADAFDNQRASGASVFVLSRSGATSESAKFLARKENEADLIGGVGGDVSLQDIDNVLAGVLVDLSMTATLTNSLDIGAHVLKSMGRIAGLHKRHVEQAGFAVLKSPDVPSILVETGFISNPREAKKLNSVSYRNQMATAIFQGIQDYYYKLPPAGSYLAWQKSGSRQSVQHHKVGNGDTLSGIAARYNVSLTQLIKVNRLSQASVIKVGQKLAIPSS